MESLGFDICGNVQQSKLKFCSCMQTLEFIHLYKQLHRIGCQLGFGDNFYLIWRLLFGWFRNKVLSRSQWKKLLNLKITPYPASVTSFVIWLTHTSYAFFNYPISASHAFCCLHPENNTTNDYKKKCSKENIIEDYGLLNYWQLMVNYFYSIIEEIH